jgi:hypothetical protein
VSDRVLNGAISILTAMASCLAVALFLGVLATVVLTTVNECAEIFEWGSQSADYHDEFCAAIGY